MSLFLFQDTWQANTDNPSKKESYCASSSQFLLCFKTWSVRSFNPRKGDLPKGHLTTATPKYLPLSLSMYFCILISIFSGSDMAEQNDLLVGETGGVVTPLRACYVCLVAVLQWRMFCQQAGCENCLCFQGE